MQGLPTIPAVPAIPGVPSVPAVPDAASLKSKLPELPSHPKAVFTLSVDSVDITTDIADRLSTLTLTDNRGFEADQLDIVLDDSDGKLALPPRGAVLKLAIGWAGSGLVDKGTFTADEITHEGTPDTLTIHARSADLSSGLTTQRERSFHMKTVGEIVRAIAAENELEPLISAQLDSLHIDHIDQTHESSAAFLTRIGKMFDAIATVKNGKLMFICAGAALTASGKPLPVVTITRASGDGHHFSIADRGSYTHVKALWTDTATGTTGECIWDKQTDADETGRAIPEKLITGNHKTLSGTFKSRAAALKAARKDWKEMSKLQRDRYVGVKASYNDINLKVSAIVSFGQADEIQNQKKAANRAEKDNAKNAAPANAFEASADNIKTLRHTYASKEAAQRAARAEWRRLQRGMATFNITLATGQPELFPEIPAIVQGFKREIDNTDWIIIKATHSLSDKGLNTKLDFEIKATELPG